MVCKLSEDIRAKIQANFRGVLASHGRPAVEEIEVKKSNLPDRVYEYLTQERGLVDVSVDLAELLWDSQKGKSSSAGLLLVATARLAGKRALLIVKLEQEGGLRAQDVLVNGKRTFDMSYFADLLMTEHNKIYKAALFCVDGVSEDGPIEGRAARPPTGALRIAILHPAGPVLVVENRATFDSAWHALRPARPSPYAAVVFGGGDAASALVTDLIRLHDLTGVHPDRIDYAGDVDIAGIEAAHQFITIARTAGLTAHISLPARRPRHDRRAGPRPRSPCPGPLPRHARRGHRPAGTSSARAAGTHRPTRPEGHPLVGAPITSSPTTSPCPLPAVTLAERKALRAAFHQTHATHRRVRATAPATTCWCLSTASGLRPLHERRNLGSVTGRRDQGHENRHVPAHCRRQAKLGRTSVP